MTCKRCNGAFIPQQIKGGLACPCTLHETGNKPTLDAKAGK